MKEPTERLASAFGRSLARHGLLVLLDGVSVLLCSALGLLVRFEGRIPPHYFRQFLGVIWAVSIAYCAMNGAWGLYGRLWQYAGAQDALAIAGSGGLTSTILFAIELFLWRPRPVPLSVIVIGGIFSTLAFAAIRYRRQFIMALLRYLWGMVSGPDRQRVLIVGAGEAAQLLARQLQDRRHWREYEVVGFVDDDPVKQGLRLHGVGVLGDRGSIAVVARQRRADLIIIAIHRISGADFRDILSICQQTEARVKVLPDVLSLLKQPPTQGDGSFLPVRDVEPRDLLGRQEVRVDEGVCRRLLEDRVVLVTGACGSIGSELCRQILRFRPGRLLLVDKDESGLYRMQLELGTPEECAAFIVADVTDWVRMEAIIAREAPDIIFHAAAYKHVPLMEAYPEEAVRVNVRGTRILCQLAARHGVERFVLISTDKAVQPSSAMGFSKRMGELLVLALNSSHGTQFTAVRFGNVIGSSGSVVSTFDRQIAQGGPVTITDERMTRYFMTPREAVSLIIQAAALTEGGDIFLLDMGQEIRIVDLAQKMIRLQGLRVGKDIDIIYTGVRPGEKFEEQLIHEGFEEREPTVHPGISRVRTPKRPPLIELLEEMERLEEMAHTSGKDEIKREMSEAVAGFDACLQ